MLDPRMLILYFLDLRSALLDMVPMLEVFLFRHRRVHTFYNLIDDISTSLVQNVH
jgi:hypothetical protein